jgi:glycosyltransferase involved in cell wall biosynthesis
MPISKPESAMQLAIEAIAAERSTAFDSAHLLYQRLLSISPMHEKVYAPSAARCLRKTTKKPQSSIHPIISIIVPCHNSETFLGQCIESILRQTILGFELILVNDGSEDDTETIIRESEKRDPRIVAISNPKASGSAGLPRNQALQICRGQYVGFVDSDDWIEPDYFQKMLTLALKENADLVINSGFTNIASDTEKSPRIYPDHQQIKYPGRLISCNQFSSMIWDKIYKRDFLARNSILLGEGPAAVDLIFNFKAYFYCKKPVVCENLGYNYRRDAPGSVTVRHRRGSSCDFELKAYDECLAWSNEAGAPASFQNYILLKQFNSLVYTCSIVGTPWLESYFKKCCSIIRKYDSQMFAALLSEAKMFYLLNVYEAFKHEDIAGFIEIKRKQDKRLLLKNGSSTKVPKSIHEKSILSPHKLVFFPDWSYSNKYQNLLYNEISNQYDTDCYGLDVCDVNIENISLLLCGESNILHIHWIHPFSKSGGIQTLLNLLESLRRKVQNLRIIWTVHNHMSHECSDIRQELRDRSKLAQTVDFIICHSNSSKLKVANDYYVNRAKIHIIPHGLYQVSSAIRALKATSSSKSRHHLTLGMFGALRPYKNTDFAISFISELNQQLPTNNAVHLVIAGAPTTPEQSHELLELASTYQWLNIIPKRLSEDEYEKRMNLVDAVFMPYTGLTTSGVALSALSLGKPFIAPSVDEIEELGSIRGKITYTDTNDLANKIMELARYAADGILRDKYDPDLVKEEVSHLMWSKIIQSSAAKTLFTPHHYNKPMQ